MNDFFTPLHIIFYFFAFVALSSACVVITARNSVRSVLALVVTFFCMAGIWMLLRAEFLSLILLLVYVGAVMTLFLFVVMMLNVEKQEYKSGSFVRFLPFGIILVLVFVALMIAALGPYYFGLTQMPAPAPLPENYSNIRELGNLLYTDYAYPFEIAGVMLLAAIIAAITLVHRGALRRKTQSVSAQININPQDRVTLVKMAPEPKQGS